MTPMPPIDHQPVSQPCQANCPPHIGKTMERIQNDLGRVTEHQLELLKSSVRLEQWSSSIDARLATLNGTVARHEQRIQDVERSQAEERAAETAVEQVNKQWQERVWPVVKVGLKGLGYIVGAAVIYHADGILKFLGALLKHKP